MVVIGLGLLASFGFCFYAGWFFADMHPIIPFLLLGIGVDDMFVIVKVCINMDYTSYVNVFFLFKGRRLQMVLLIVLLSFILVNG